jgi:hypothetical protein
VQALARLRFSTVVAQSDIDEALRLMQMSKFSLYTDERKKSGLDPISDIYSIIRDEAARAHTMDVSYNSALNWISRKVCLFVFQCQLAKVFYSLCIYGRGSLRKSTSKLL